MTTLCKDIVDFMEQTAPAGLAEDWDNIGLLLGTGGKAVRKIILSLDVTEAVVKEAAAKNADMLITHHPVIFKGIKSLIEDNAKGRLLYELIRNTICVYAAHTNLDYAEPGVNTCLAESLGLTALETLGKGPGKTGFLRNETDLASFVRIVKDALDVPYVRVAGKAGRVKKVAVFSGSFDDNLEAVRQSGADVLVTGDLKYHTALDAAEAGMCVMDAGHFNTEKIILPVLAEALKTRFPQVEVLCFRQEEDPFKTY